MTELALFWQELSARPDFWGFISIPLVAAIVTWLHVWWAMQMVFYPLEFVGLSLPRRAGGKALHLLGWDHPDEPSLAAMLARQERLLQGDPGLFPPADGARVPLAGDAADGHADAGS